MMVKSCLLLLFAFTLLLIAVAESVSLSNRRSYFRKLCLFDRAYSSRFALYAAASDKTRVKLLTDVKGIGKKGEILFVSPSLYTNVLQVKKTAVKITDDELKSIELKEKETARMELEKGSQTIKLISALSSFQIKRKVGANKQLFGSVSNKVVLEELKKLLPPGSLENKAVSILSITEQADEKNPEAAGELDQRNKESAKSGELRRAGNYIVKLRVVQELDPVSFSFSIVPEKP